MRSAGKSTGKRLLHFKLNQFFRKNRCSRPGHNTLWNYHHAHKMRTLLALFEETTRWSTSQTTEWKPRRTSHTKSQTVTVDWSRRWGCVCFWWNDRRAAKSKCWKSKGSTTRTKQKAGFPPKSIIPEYQNAGNSKLISKPLKSTIFRRSWASTFWWSNTTWPNLCAKLLRWKTSKRVHWQVRCWTTFSLLCAKVSVVLLLRRPSTVFAPCWTTVARCWKPIFSFTLITSSRFVWVLIN